MSGDRRATLRGAYANFLYITRQAGSDAYGTIDYTHRADLVAHGLELPPSHPKWAREPGRIWREVDMAAEDLRSDAVKAWHIALTLPAGLSQQEAVARVREFSRETLVRRGPAVAWAIHAEADTMGGWKIRPHVHLLMTTRGWKHNANFGRPIAAWHGAAIRAAIHVDWLARLPISMQRAASAPYRSSTYVPAYPDCSAIAHLLIGAER
ncbi:MobA/MobL family protein [Sphingomonas sp. 22176]|uniref:MobA/MobL family protein n=1 Tax=Sphingomonas sp. 22176 TaxID=3453884 RepID=UPI003F85BE57